MCSMPKAGEKTSKLKGRTSNLGMYILEAVKEHKKGKNLGTTKATKFMTSFHR